MCNGTTDLGTILPLLDDDSEFMTPTGGVMALYLEALMKRLQNEASPSRPLNDPTWLLEYLRRHGFWISCHTAPYICSNLKIPFMNKSYYRDLRVWFPDLEGGIDCMPCCVTCKSNSNVRVHSYPMEHPARRIITFTGHYYIMSRQYLCRTCRAQQIHDKSIQYTFMGYHDVVLQNLPRHL